MPMDEMEVTEPVATPAESAAVAEAAAAPEGESKAAAAESAAAPPAEASSGDKADVGEASEEEDVKPGSLEVLVVEGKRERKSTERMEYDHDKKKKKMKGTGTPLGEMEHVQELMMDAKNKDALVDLHQIVFKSKGAKGKHRKNFLDFSGLAYGDAEVERPRFVERLMKMKTGAIHGMLDLCHVDRSAKSFEDGPHKDALCQRLMDFLEKPSRDLQKKIPTKKQAKAKAKAAPAKPKAKAAPAKKAAPKRKRSEPEDDADDDDAEADGGQHVELLCGLQGGTRVMVPHLSREALL